MRLYSASPHAHVSMCRDAALDRALDDAMQQHRVHHVVETGTYLGTGSTTALAEALLRSGVAAPHLDTIEVNWAHHCHARSHLARFPFVKCHWGLSVRTDAAIEFIQHDAILENHTAEPDIFIDEVVNPRNFYLNEVHGNIRADASTVEPAPSAVPPDGLLEPLLQAVPSSGTLILLDSAGGIGLLEFQITLQVMRRKKFLLLLDDTGHLKHYRSRQLVAQDRDFSVLAEGSGRDWLLAAYSPPQ